jgi:hypothetical protein
MADDPVIRAVDLQARACEVLGSAFSAALLRRATDDLAAGGPSRALFAPWAGTDARMVMRDAAPLRFLGALHERVLSSEVPELATLYPALGRPGDPAAAWSEASRLIARDQDRLAEFMTHEPQTNESRRSICLLGGFLTAAAETELPMRIFELGASAGLNNLWDRYRYRLDGAGAWGEHGSPVRMDTEWRGPPPPFAASIRVTERAACDRKPVAIVDAAARRRLRAYIWPDQPERLARLDAAIGLALEAGTTVDAADAYDWTVRRVAPKAGAVTVLFHSVFWQYMPSETQAGLDTAITGIGASATSGAPFAWLRMEPRPDNLAVMEVRLTLWPGGEDRLLAHCHPHGAWVEWRA